ncbi:MAG TPA: N-acetylglucosamine-6-phosphate deacetylase [Planctomycetota bacterium]|nr:N-acetylglucosamine-6-phosphate deacetylase [Planctomycetota bacterium]
MSSTGSLRAWHYRTRAPVEVAWADGVFTRVEPTTREPDGDAWIAPGLVELQVNGYGGINFRDDRVGAAELTVAVRRLRRDGCSRLLVTITTDHWPALMERLRCLREARAGSAELRAAIAGWHIEGPFLSEVPGFIGAHPPERTCDPTPERIRELRAVTGDDPVLLTLAPERRGAIDAIRLATALGIRVAIGHADPPLAVLRAAVEAGAVAVTHAGNGIPQALDRHDNILWRILETPGLTLGVIPDTVHVSPALFRIFHRLVDAGRIYYTTDAVHPAGMPPGRFLIGATEMEVGEDQVVRKPGATNFAGSAARPLECLFRAVDMLGCAWQDAWARYSHVPADLMGLGELMAPGRQADLCVLDGVGGDAGVVRTYAGGVLCSTLPARARLRGALLTHDAHG